MTTNASLQYAQTADTALLVEVKRLAQGERLATVQLVAALAEVDARKLYLGEGCSSMFTYCTQVLRLSEHAAYGRIQAARAGRRFPLVLDLLQEGALTLTSVTLLAPHLTADNHRQLLQSATHKSKREVERIVAGLRPLPDVPAAVRKLPAPSRISAPARATVTPPPPSMPAETLPLPMTSSADVARQPPRPPAVVAPLAPERYKLQLTIDQHTHDKLCRVRDLLRHRVPSGDLATIFDRALTLLLAEVERTKLAATARPRRQPPACSRSRHVPAAVKRLVWSRDGGRCAFVGSNGRCTERSFLEFHHLLAYADGGETTAPNLELRCRAHNQYDASDKFDLFSPMVRERQPRYAAALGPDRVC